MDRIKSKIQALYSGKLDKPDVTSKNLEKFGLTDITLRPYQLASVNWMLQRYHRGHGCVLGDEMGLGKTCQTISVLVALAGLKESRGPHLLLCPLSVLDNWKSELKRFAPGVKFFTYVGDKDRRLEIRADFKDEKESVLLSTYDIFLRDESFLRRFTWHTLVVDEAHRLKNRDSLLHQSLLEFDITHRILLTGTPVQNNLRELYSLLCFVAPSIFKFRYCEEFLETYSEVEDKSEATELHQMLVPFLLRRVKSQVLKDLPKRSEVILFHGLSALQKKFYKAILTKDLDVFNTGYNTPKTRLMNILMQLRKCVNHPYLFDGVEPEPFMLGEHLVEASGKLVLVDQLLEYLKPLGHKVLIFSQMTRMLDIVQDYLGYRGYSYERLDGSVRGEERFLAIKNFNSDESTFIFLLSTKAGGVGLNLVAADTIIFIDSDFNPQNDLQAAARAHRIGQKRPVKVVRLIGRSTVEEIILRRAEAKLKLTDAVIGTDQFSHGAGTSTAKEDLVADNAIQLQDILKFGVDKLLKNDDSSIETMDFDAILGPTVDSEWTEVADKQSLVTLAAQSMGVDTLGDGDDEEEGAEETNMYQYEGTDYSQQPSAADKEAVNKLIEAYKVAVELDEEEGARPLRRTKTNVLKGLLPEPGKRTRKPLTTEEIEQRNKKGEEDLCEADSDDKPYLPPSAYRCKTEEQKADTRFCWTRVLEDQLIALFKEHQILYNKDLPEFRSIKKKRQAKEDIAVKLNVDYALVDKRIGYLRERYSSSLKAKKRERSTKTFKMTERQKFIWTQLSFLGPYFTKETAKYPMAKQAASEMRAETLARKAKEAEEEEKRREERRQKRRDALWKANNYSSCNLELPDSDDDEEEEEDTMATDDDGDGNKGIIYVTGDVTKPDDAIKGDVIIVHCVDDSGGWGSGGLFSALSKKSDVIEQQYELAGEMKDLHLGDVHLVELKDNPDRTEHVAVLVAQSRDRHGALTGIKLSALSDGLRKIYTSAKKKKASVHLPRIGHSTPGFNWYGTERLIRKHLASRNIPTYIYYFKRRQQPLKRRRSSSSPEPSTRKRPANSGDDIPEPSRKTPKMSPSMPLDLSAGLPDFMSGVAACFVGLPADLHRTCYRYLIAFDGDVHSDIDDGTTHLVTMATPTKLDRQKIEKITEAYPEVQVVKTTWLTRCFSKLRKVDLSRHLLELT